MPVRHARQENPAHRGGSCLERVTGESNGVQRGQAYTSTPRVVDSAGPFGAAGKYRALAERRAAEHARPSRILRARQVGGGRAHRVPPLTVQMTMTRRMNRHDAPREEPGSVVVEKV